MMTIRKIALISPMWRDKENPYPPLGIGYIASVLEKNGYAVRIFDLSLYPEKSFENKIQEVIDFEPDLLGITCMTNTYSNGLKIAQRVKNEISVPVVMGGPHPTVYPLKTLENDVVDFVIAGEGEYVMLDLLRVSEENYDKVPALAYKRNGETFFNKSYCYIENLDEIPYPARHLLALDSYSLKSPSGEKMATVISSRGCPYGCTYCFKELFGRKYRARSSENILGEILELKEKFGFNFFYFVDDLFTFDPDRIKNICDKMIETKLNVQWQCIARVDKINYELLRIMKSAGCFKVHYGIESGNNDILKKTKKGITLNQIRETIIKTKNAGISIKGYFMLGLPGETRKTMMQTIKFAEELRLDETMFSITTPFPGTELWNNIPDEDKIRLFNLSDKAYYFSDISESSILYNMSEEADGTLMDMLAKADTLNRRQRFEKRFGKKLGYGLYKLTTLPILSYLIRLVSLIRKKINKNSL